MPNFSSPGTLPPDVMAAIRQQFHLECEEHLAALETGLLDLQNGAGSTDTINILFRAAHSIKGGAATFGMKNLVELAHRLESALSTYRSDGSVPGAPAIETLLRAVDRLSDIERAACRDDDATGIEMSDVLASLESLVRERKPAISATEPDLIEFTPQQVRLEDMEPTRRTWSVRFHPLREFYARACEPLPLFRELQSLGDIAVTLDDKAVPLLDDLVTEESCLRWSIALDTSADEQEIRAIFEFVEGDCELEILPQQTGGHPYQSCATDSPKPAALRVPDDGSARGAPAAVAQTIRVDLERVDRLVNLIGELVISQAAVSERVSNSLAARNPQVLDSLEDLRLLTRDLQEGVMAIRAQPVKTVFQRLPRMVRELEVETGKRVRLELEGEGTEIDRGVVEGLADPLAHLIRNAVDHGIEAPGIRSLAGKPEVGCIRVSAAHRAGRIIIEVSDDGAGIDRECVRSVAIKRGLIAADSNLDDAETDALIFEPGFSTSSAVTSLSGRGVGMDVVKRGIQALGGRIAVVSRASAGTTFTLSLPLTLAVLDGMLVSSCDQQLVVPLASLLKTVRLSRANVRRFGADTDILVVSGDHVPLVDLGTLLGFRTNGAASGGEIALVVEDDAGQMLALRIDDIQGQRQVVIKSLETHYRAIDGIAAATILGNGSVALILDVNAIIVQRKSRPPERMIGNG